MRRFCSTDNLNNLNACRSSTVIEIRCAPASRARGGVIGTVQRDLKESSSLPVFHLLYILILRGLVVAVLGEPAPWSDFHHLFLVLLVRVVGAVV